MPPLSPMPVWGLLMASGFMGPSEDWERADELADAISAAATAMVVIRVMIRLFVGMSWRQFAAGNKVPASLLLDDAKDIKVAALLMARDPVTGLVHEMRHVDHHQGIGAFEHERSPHRHVAKRRLRLQDH